MVSAVLEKPKTPQQEQKERFGKYFRKIDKISRVVAGNTEEAEDLRQQVLYKILANEKKGKFIDVPDEKLDSYLFSITLNAFRDSLRKERTKSRGSGVKPLALDQDDFKIDPKDKRAASPLEVLSIRERNTQIRRAVDKLPRVYREAVERQVLGGLSYRDTAEIVDTKKGTVATRISRAKQLLKQLLGPLVSLPSRAA